MTTQLTKNQIDGYQQSGFIHPVDVLDPKETAHYRQRFETYETQHGGWYELSKGQKLYLLQTWVAELARHRNVLDAVEGVLGPNILCWGCSLFVKEPRNPHFVSWPQDSAYWGLSSANVVTAWIALSPATKANGAMKMARGSHRLESVPHHDTLHEHNLLTRGQEIAMEVDESDAAWVELAAGQASLHNIRTIHASEPNESDHRRIGVAIRYIAPHVRQVNAEQDSAWLVRGVDEHGNFSHETPPVADMDPAAVQEHTRVMAIRQGVLYQGVQGQPAHTAIGEN